MMNIPLYVLHLNIKSIFNCNFEAKIQKEKIPLYLVIPRVKVIPS